jgi:cbb3-type cytochrome oxidase cytochrome c subunit|tara:strand:+ start:229 stop:435 length:207 start_codon:yes stop_codon:yes gene_type:complete
MAERIRYGAGGVPYIEKTIETEKADLEASYKQSIANKKERTKKKKKKVIQEIMGDDLVENKETLDEII